MPERIVAICQPNFFPWLGYFEMADRADIFVMLDDVQYISREWVNRNKILSRSRDGWQWIVVPLKKSPRETLIAEIEIQNDPGWSEKMLETAHHVYRTAPYYGRYFEPLKRLLSQRWPRLLDLNMASIKFISNALGIKENFHLSSELKISSRKDDKLADICSALGATIYLANNGSKTYIAPSKFTGRNIGFVFQDYEHPAYGTGDYGFLPYLSALDPIFWHGPAALEIILKGRDKNWRDGIVRAELDKQHV